MKLNQHQAAFIAIALRVAAEQYLKDVARDVGQYEKAQQALILADQFEEATTVELTSG
jgi:hypothetical protein